MRPVITRVKCKQQWIEIVAAIANSNHSPIANETLLIYFDYSDSSKWGLFLYMEIQQGSLRKHHFYSSLHMAELPFLPTKSIHST